MSVADGDATGDSTNFNSGSNGESLPSARPIGKAIDPAAQDASTTGLPVATQQASHGSLNSNVATAQDAQALQSSPEAQFGDANHAKIVTAMHGQLLPNGGTMHLRLDPPELGAVNIRVEMRDGVMTASFETTSDQAAKLLSHSLGDLKTALEAQGVSVDKLHVRQSANEESAARDSRRGGRDPLQDRASQQEQQRRDMLRRMWRRLMKGQGPLDLVA